MNRLPAVPFFAPALVLLAAMPAAWGQATRTQMLEAANTARMQSKMEQATGYSEPSRASTGANAYVPAAAPASTYSSNRSYDQGEEDAALTRARRMKEAMRSANPGSLPSLDRRKEPVSTGITDGNWQSERIDRIRSAYSGERVEEPRGVLAKVGGVLDNLASNEEEYIRRRRAGELDEGFRPLERLSSGPRPADGDDGGPGLFQKTANAAGAVTGSLTAAAGGIGAAAGKLIPDGRSNGNANERARIEPAEAGQEAATAPIVIAASAPAPAPQPAPAPTASASPEPAAARSGFAMPWNRPNRGSGDPQPAETTTAPDPEPADAVASKPKSETKPSRVTIPGVGRGSTKSTPDGPMAPDQFRVVQSPSGTEFYPYDSPTPVPKILPDGGLLEVIKPGDEWSGVVLPDGTEGIVRTGMLRRARMSEMPREAFEPTPSLPSAPAHKPVNYEASANLTLPDLPTPDETSMPLGQGLLPPLQPEN